MIEQRHRGSEIRFEKNQSDQPADHDADWHQRVRDVVDALHPALEERRNEEDRAQLRELGRLHAKSAEAKPAAAAVDGRGEQDADQRKHDEPERHPDERRLPVIPVVEAHGDAHRRQAKGGPHRLLDQEEIGLVEPVHRQHCGGAVDHDHAGAHQQQRGEEEYLVGLELSRHS